MPDIPQDYPNPNEEELIGRRELAESYEEFIRRKKQEDPSAFSRINIGWRKEINQTLRKVDMSFMDPRPLNWREIINNILTDSSEK